MLTTEGLARAGQGTNDCAVSLAEAWGLDTAQQSIGAEVFVHVQPVNTEPSLLGPQAAHSAAVASSSHGYHARRTEIVRPSMRFTTNRP